MIAQYAYTWGEYHLFYPQRPEQVVHPDDLATVYNMVAGWNAYTGRRNIFYCSRIEYGYLWLQSENALFRARPEQYRITPTPVYVWGDRVRLKAKPERIRRVIRMHFHPFRRVVVYQVESSDPIGRAYWFEDQLERVDELQSSIPLNS